MKFKTSKDSSHTNYGLFTAYELSYKEFIKLSFDEFVSKKSKPRLTT